MTGLILLAAGNSSRLGHPKQKVVYQGKTLLQRAIDAALGTDCAPVIVILGAYSEHLQADILKERFTIVENSNWENGMASSIRAGILRLQQIAPQGADVILMVSDQPFVDTEILNKLIEKKIRTGSGIVACSYTNTLGVPALFNKKYFDELLSLTGQEGAKKLLKKHNRSIAIVDFPFGNIDIDTAADIAALEKLRD